MPEKEIIMADVPKLDDQGNPIVPEVKDPELTQAQKDALLLEETVAARTAESLKEIKAKLDSAYAQRDAALAAKATLELAEKELQKKKLEEEGKWKELYELQLQEAKDKAAVLQAEKAALEAMNTELSRDNSVRNALKSIPFRNDTASEMAYKEITAQLVRNEKGEWTHRTGVTIKEFADSFAKNEDNSFLLKPKSSSGSGSREPEGKPQGNQGKSLFNLTQKQVLEGIENGTIKTR